MTAPEPGQASGIERSLLVLVTALWGVNFVSARLGLESTTPLGFRAITFGGAVAILLIVCLVRRTSLALPERLDLVHLAVAGVFSIAVFGVLAALAVLHSDVGRTSIVVYTMPLWVVVFSRVVLGERMRGLQRLAVLVGAAGIIVLMTPLVIEGAWLGPLYALGAALSWAIGTVWLKAARVQAAPVVVTVWQLLAGTAALLIAVLVTGDEVITGPMTGGAWWGVIYTTIAGTVVAYVIWFQVVQRLPAGVAGMGTLLVPVFGVIASILALGERPTVFDGVGFALICGGGVLALLPPRGA